VTRRLDQWLVRCGYASRREALQWICGGRVTRDGIALADPAQHVSPDGLHIDGEPIEAPEGILAMLHKPAGFVCSRDEREGPNVFELVPARWSRRHPAVTTVGRLDKDTTGLLLLTDIGSLVQKWTSPRHHVEKTYEVTVDGQLQPDIVTRFASGELLLEGDSQPCRPARLEIVSGSETRLHLIEGRFRQVRRMFAAVGLRVIRLHRCRFGEFELLDLPEGAWKRLPRE
jgi:16S rRNA pseudouridine516 synthase